jgi:hypothetical protein
LPPLVNRSWDASAAHEPDIPVQKVSERDGGMGGDMLRRAPPGGLGRDRMMPGAGMMPGRGMMPGGPGGGRGGREPSADGTPFDENASGDDARKGAAEAERVEEKRPPAYKLFRFFDFSVKPNRQYVYRVCLALRNPNQDVKPVYLKNAELAKETYLKTKWSGASPGISVPRDTRILLVSVKPPRPGGEPTGEVLITKWVEKTGVEAFIKESPIARGQVLNFPDRTGKTIGAVAPRQAESRPGAMGPMGLERLGGRQPAMFSAPATGSSTKEDFNSDATAVDIRVGSRPKKGTSNPADEILILDAEGNLSVHDDLDELAAYDEITTAAVEPAAARPAAAPGRFGPGMGLPGVGPRGGGLEALEQPGKKKPAKAR